MASTRSTRNRLDSTAPQVNHVSEDEQSREESDDGGGWTTQEKKKRSKVKQKSKLVCKGGKKVCGIPIDSDECIQCDLCEECFHPRCQELTIDAFRARANYDFIWLCLRCRPNFMHVLKLGRQIEARIETAEGKILEALKASTPRPENTTQLEDKISEMEKAVAKELKEQKVEVEKALKMHTDLVHSMPKIQTELKKSAQELKNIVEKKEDKERREVNIIIHNIPESEASNPEERKKYDSDSFNNVVHALLGDDVNMTTEKVLRLGKKRERQEGEEEPKPRLMLVRLKKKEDVEMLMKERFNLSEAGFENIYLSRDLSPEERDVQRKLREEWTAKGRRTHRIFQGKVIPRKQ